MIPRAALDASLVFVVAVWALLSLIIIFDRVLYDRRARRTALLHNRLRKSATTGGTDYRDVRRIARSLTGPQFQDMALAGLPRGVEIAMALELRAHGRKRSQEGGAFGAAGADVWERIAALQLLVSSQHPAAYAALDRGLCSGEPALAAAAARMLIRLDNRRAAGILVGALRTGAYTQSRLAAALDRLSVPRSDLLAPLFHAVDPTVRFWGVRLAGRLRALEWAAPVRKLTADPDPRVRRAAVEALGALGAPADRTVLIGRFHDEVPMVRAHAARASESFADASVAAALAPLLVDREWMVRAAARETLGRIGHPGRSVLLRMLWHGDTFAANSAAEILCATGTLARAGRMLLKNSADQDAAHLLERFLEVAGPHLPRAFFEQFRDDEAAALLAIVQARTVGEART